jgi:flavorubredoxin
VNRRVIREGVHWMGAVDWDRRLFDCLIPTPDGTSYNAYLVEGAEKTALLDTVDPTMTDVLMDQLSDVPQVDYLVSHHAEQDHSGAIACVLQKYPGAKVVTNPKCKEMLIDHLCLSEDAFLTVKNNETISLGGKTLQFVYTPWVHWPETMVTYLKEDKILFSCDFFGSHFATSELYASSDPRVFQAAKRYYAEIMMPFYRLVRGNLEKVRELDVELIAPSHGPIYSPPGLIMDAYAEWVSDDVRNVVVIPYVSMHGSTKKMVEHLASALVDRGVMVEQFDMTATDVGTLAMSFIDAASVVFATPTFLVGPHPLVLHAAGFMGALKPTVKLATVIGSYGWGGKAAETVMGALGKLKVRTPEPVLCVGYPKEADLASLDSLADAIAAAHKELGLRP